MFLMIKSKWELTSVSNGRITLVTIECMRTNAHLGTGKLPVPMTWVNIHICDVMARPQNTLWNIAKCVITSSAAFIKFGAEDRLINDFLFNQLFNWSFLWMWFDGVYT